MRSLEEQGAHFGAVLDSAGEMLVLVDDRGELVDEEKYLALFSLITARDQSRCDFGFAHATAPQAVIGKGKLKAGGKNRKTAPWALMGEFKKDDVGLSQYFPSFFSIMMLLQVWHCLLKYLAKEGKALSMILSELPGFAVARKEVGLCGRKRKSA